MPASSITKRTSQQSEILDRLAGDVAEVWEERGVFRTTEGFESRSRLRVSTYSIDHDYGALILNEDGSLWADDGATRLQCNGADHAR